MSKLSVLITQQESKKIIHIEGVLDEDFLFAKYPLNDASELEFFLGKVKKINSCGIREWIKWLNTVKGVKARLYECPKLIVDQINMVHGFMPENCTMESFYVPYFNEASGAEKIVLFSRGKEYTDGELHFPTDIKDEKGEAMEMDVIESKYFRFLKKKP